jgi:PAS domain S-box-containing protein
MADNSPRHTTEKPHDRAERELRESEERFRTVAEFTYDWETWVGPDSRLLYVSPSAERITGYGPEEFQKNPGLLESLVHPADRGAHSRHVDEALALDAPSFAEFRIIHRNGEERWIDHRCQPVYGVDGRWLGRRGSNRDITERKRAEIALRESEERFRELIECAADAIFVHDLAGRVVDFNQRACESLQYSRKELGNLSVSDIETNYDPRALSEIWEEIASKGPVTLLGAHRRKDGSTFPTETRVGSFEFHGQRLVVALARDITERESLRRVSAALLQKPSLDEVLGVVCSEAQRLTGAAGSAVLLREEEDWLRLTESTGSPKPALDRLPIEGSLAGAAVHRGEPLLVNDPQRNVQAYHRNSELESLLAIPLRIKNAVVGVLDVVNKPGGFEREDVRALSLFADQAAIAIENARLHEKAERLAVMEERQRLARELHDSVTQALYSVTLYADAARMAMSAGKQEAVADHLQELRAMAREAMLDMRLLIFELHPPALEEEGLVGALKTRLAAVESRAGLKTEILVEGEGQLSLQTEETLYRFSCEALNNVLKHAQAQSVTVRVQFQDELVRLEVVDDGVGFDPASVRQGGGVGMRSMEDRVRQANGRLAIHSSPGEGTKVTAEMGI